MPDDLKIKKIKGKCSSIEEYIYMYVCIAISSIKVNR